MTAEVGVPTIAASGRARPRTGRWFAGLLAGSLLLAAAGGGPAGQRLLVDTRQAAALPAQSGSGIKPAHIAVLVDESGSISQQDMTREQESAGLIAQAEFSPGSTVGVVGFGSDNGSQSAVDPVCPPTTVANPAQRQELSDCVGLLKKRLPGQGDDTDFVQALQQGLSYVDAANDGAPRIIFMLTDGRLDVGNSPQYGADKTPEQRDAAAQVLLDQTLAEGQQQQVEVWPLGFGEANKPALDHIAASAFQGTCATGSQVPMASLVASSADIDTAIFNAYSSARCVGIGPIQNRQLGAGQQIDIPIDIPPIATDGSIVVLKRDPAIGIAYIAPDGKEVPTNGTVGASTYSISGENGPVEALRIVNPQPGRWKVRATAPPTGSTQVIGTTVTWQGAVQASIEADPPAPAVGQAIRVSMQLHLRGGRLVADPGELAGLSFSAELTGDGFLSMPIALSGSGPGHPVDGTFTGQVTIPSAARGSVTLLGHAHGVGISGDDPRETIQIAPLPAQVTVSADLPQIGDKVHPGGRLPATVTAINSSGMQRTVRLLIKKVAGADVTLSQVDARHVIAASGPTTFPINLVYGANGPTGPTSAVLMVVDDANPSTEFSATPFTVTVTPPFPWKQVLADIAGFVVIVIVAVVLALYWRRRQDADVRGLAVQAFRDGHDAYLPSQAERGTQLRFTLDTSGPVPRLEHAEPGDDNCYRLTRSRAGLVLRNPDGEMTPLQLGRRHEIAPGVSVEVTDELADERGNVPAGPDESEQWSASSGPSWL